MNNLYLLVTIAGSRVAFPVASVESVVEIDNIEPVPLVPQHVAGLFALRSRVLTVIDSRAAVGLGRHDWTGYAEAVIANCEGHGYAIIVENVDDVIEPTAPCMASRAVLSPGWARVALGMIEVAGEATLVVDPAVLIAGESDAIAA